MRFTCIQLACVITASAAPARAGTPSCPSPFPVLQLDAGGSPRAVATGDLNADGYSDIVATRDNEFETAVILSNGDGTFAPRARCPRRRLAVHARHRET